MKNKHNSQKSIGYLYPNHFQILSASRKHRKNENKKPKRGQVQYETAKLKHINKKSSGKNTQQGRMDLCIKLE